MTARKPTAMKVLAGTDRPDRHRNEPSVETLAEKSPPPTWLSPRGRRAWRDLLPLLRSMKVATTVDPAAFALLCDALAEYIDARRVVIRDGATYKTFAVGDDGEVRLTMIRARPEVTIASEAWRRAKMMLTEFGLTPASRSKVSTHQATTEDPLAKWAAGE